MGSKSVLFPYQPLEEAVDKWMRGYVIGRQAQAAWQMFKGMVIVNSIIHYGVRPQSTVYIAKKGLHMPWEDACVALRGGGDNSMTGPLLTMWEHIWDEDSRRELGQEMNLALVNLYQHADAIGYKHRYEEQYRIGPVITDSQRFKLPVAIPSGGGKVRNWAWDEGLDLNFVQEYLLDLVSQKQTKLKEQEAQLPSPEASPIFQVLAGGRK